MKSLHINLNFQGTWQKVIVFWSMMTHRECSTVKMEETCSSETLVPPVLISKSAPIQRSLMTTAVGYNILSHWRIEDRGIGVWVPVGPRIFSSPRCPDRLWGPPNLLSNGNRGSLSSGVKHPGREADNSPPTSADVKKMWLYKFTPPYDFMA
jgi:hypothetical protein